MKIIDVRARTVPISRYADVRLPSEGLTTTMVALLTDVQRGGQPVVGYGFGSIGRFDQTGLVRERFAPRLVAASAEELADSSGTNIDPIKAWHVMMRAEKPGGHGERCVAVGTLDMALWDAAAKIANKPAYRHIADTFGEPTSEKVQVYAGGGYYFPDDDVARLKAEVKDFLERGFTSVKIKIGGRTLSEDLNRIEAVLSILGSGRQLAVDAMNRYAAEDLDEVLKALTPYKLRWFEDVCDPLDFDSHALLARRYAGPIAAGEALFSYADARNLFRYGGLRPSRDILVFDPVHCYGIAEYARILSLAEASGWSRSAFFPHGGHLFSLHVAAAFRLGGAESNPHNFQPFGGCADDAVVADGALEMSDAPGVGFETRSSLYAALLALMR